EDIARFDRTLYFGYDGWEWDVITALEASPPTSDSLWESLGRAYDFYAGGYAEPIGMVSFQNNDPDRRPLPDGVTIPMSRIRKFIPFEQKSIAAYQRLYALNKHYQCAFYDVGTILNTMRMAAYTTLTLLGFDDLKAPFLRDVSYPDTVLQKASSLLR